MTYVGGLILLLILFISTNVQAQTSPQGVSLQGRILDSGNVPLEDASVTFTVQIYSPGAESCELYRETHSINMTGSGGIFSLPVGSGTRSGAGFENTSTMAQVFNNASGTINSLTCSIGTSYAPSSGAKRRVKMTFDNGGGPQVVTTMLDVQAVPFALYADTLQGKGPTDFLQTSALTTQTKIDNLAATANYNELLALIAGTSTNFVTSNGANFTPAADVDFNGKKIINLATPTLGTDAVTKTYSDTKFGGATFDQTGLANGQSIRWNSGATKWEVYTPSTTDTTKLPLAGGTMSGAIDMGSNNLLNVGHITMPAQKTIHLGSYTDAQETTLVSGLVAGDEGKIWYNSDANRTKIWTGAAPALVQLTAGDIGTAASKVMGADAVPNCLSTQKLQMSAGPVYSWSCVADNSGQWTTTGSDIYYTTGNVGIGTSTPQSPLHIQGVTPRLTFFDTDVAIGANNPAFAIRAQDNLGAGTGGLLIQTTTDHSAYTDVFAIGNTGKVGIGTITPSAKLDVAGNIKIGDSGAVTCDNTTKGSQRYNATSNKMEFCNGTAWADIDTTGGAGDASGPASSTDNAIARFDGTTGKLIQNSGVTIDDSNNLNVPGVGTFRGNTNAIVIQDSGGTTYGYIQANGGVGIRGDANSGGAFVYGSGGAGLFVDSAGKAGIGTNSPTSLLDISGNTNALSTIWVRNSNNGATARTMLNLANDNADYSSIYIKSSTAASDPGALIIDSNSAGGKPTLFTQSGVERMRIDGSGSVGIGTTAPKAPFQVGSSTVLQTNEADKNAHFVGNMYFDGTNWKLINNGGGGLMNIEAGNGSIGFYTAPAGTAGNNAALSNNVRILNSGNVGIGTQTPEAKLDVAGDIKMGNSGATCNGTTEGSQRYNTTTDKMEFCNGTAWAEIGSGAGGGTIDSLSDAFTDYTNHNYITGRTSAAALTADASYNTFVGDSAGATSANSTATTDENSAFGYLALTNLSSGGYNTALGAFAMRNTTTGSLNTAIGPGALYANTTGSQNVAIGQSTLATATNVTDAVAIGYQSMMNSTASGGNTAVGSSSLRDNTTGGSNVAIGSAALLQNTTGGSNTAVGVQALYTNTTGNTNTAVGRQTMLYSTGSNNAAFGYGVLLNATGNNNTVIGTSSGTAMTTGTDNTILGYGAGNNITTGNSNIIIGAWHTSTSATANNFLNIGGTIMGDTSTKKIGIGTATPADYIHVYSTANSAGAGITIDNQGTGNAQQSWLNLLSLGDGTKAIGTAGTKGWSVTARSNAYSIANQQNDFGITYWDGSSWIAPLWMDSGTGNVGVNTQTPVAKFEVGGNIKIGDSGAVTCDATTEGSQRFNATTDKMEFCNGTAWGNIDAGGSGTVTEVTVTAPLGVTNGTTTPALTISDATTGAKGVMQVGTGLAVSSGTVSVSAGTASGDLVNNNDVPNCTAGQKLEITAGPTYTWSCVTDLGSTVDSMTDSYFDSGAPHALIIGRTSAGALTAGAEYNMFIGDGAGATAANSTATTDRNIAIGTNSLTSLTSGDSNTAIGHGALYSNTTGGGNVAIGSSSTESPALGTNTTGSSNTAIGSQALSFNTTANWNTAVGAHALKYNTTASYNTAVGSHALVLNTTGGGNAALGNDALYSNTIGASNTGIGSGALNSNKAKGESTAVGVAAMAYAHDTTTASITYNTAVGFSALRGSTTAANNNGTYNTVVGHSAMMNNTSGSQSTAIGARALGATTTGMYNTAIGMDSMQLSTNSYYNTAVGNQSLMDNQTGWDNTAIGMNALQHNYVGRRNTALGAYSLQSNYNKEESTAIGYLAMYYADNTATTGVVTYNTAIGAYALQGSTTAANNTGTANTALGHSSLKGITSGSNNTAIGYNAGNTTTTGAGNILIGSGVVSPLATTDNHLNIGNTIYGDLSTDFVGIGVAAPAAKLEVGGDIRFGNSNATCDVTTEGSQRYNFVSDVMEFCNGSSWGTLAGSGATTVSANAGAVGTPSMTFSGDSNTGFYSNGADTIGISSGGSNVFNISSSSISSPTTGGALITSGNGTVGAPTFSFAGDEDTGWWRPGANTMAASTAGAERVRIDSNGNVGIGTTSPAAKLDVRSDAVNAIVSGGAGVGSYGVVIAASSRGTITAPTATQSGDILGVFGSMGRGATSFPVASTASMYTVATEVWTDTAQGTRTIFQTTPNTTATALDRVIIDSTGKVGIGSTVPTSDLHISRSVNGGVDSDVTNTNAGASAYAEMGATTVGGDVGIGVGSTAYNGGVAYFWNYNNTATKFGTNNTERMRIAADGNVGIGTTAPTHRLEVKGSATSSGGPKGQIYIDAAGSGTTGYFTVNADTGQESGLLMTKNSGGAGNEWWVYNGSAGDFKIAETIAGPAWPDRLAIQKTTGNVGIGTTGPGYILDVQGSGAGVNGDAVMNIKRTTASSNGFLHIDVASASQDAGIRFLEAGALKWTLVNLGSDDSFRIYNHATSSTSMLVTTAGNVGIGTDAPGSKLAVHGAYVDPATNGGTLRLESTDAAAQNKGGSIAFAGQADAGRTFGVIGGFKESATGADYAGYLSFSSRVSGGSNSEKMRITSTGNVGIGTTNPQASLDIVSTSHLGMRLETTAGASELWFNAYLANTTAPFRIITNSSANTNPISFDPGGNEAMRINPGGNVGIGTTSTANAGLVVDKQVGATFALFGPTSSNSVGIIGGAGGGDSGVSMNTYWNGSVWKSVGAGYSAYAGFGPAGGDYYIYSSSSSIAADATVTLTNRFFISETGKVGLGGQTAPAYTLDVTGDANKTVGGTSWSNVSDARLKTVTGDLGYGLEEILQLNPVRFRYKDIPSMNLSSKEENYGFVAQEVQKVIPEAVATRKDGYLELHVDPIHWAAINAIKELNNKCEMSKSQQETLNQMIVSRLENAEREISSLKKENEDLKTRLLRLERLANFD